MANTKFHLVDLRQNGNRKSGRVAFTDDGRSTWEWQTATGVFSRNVSDEQVAALAAADLAIVEAPPVNAMDPWGSNTGRFTHAKPQKSKVVRTTSRSSSGLQRLLRRFTGTH